MDKKDQQQYKKFLEDQLQWSRERSQILEKIEHKLHEMKSIAETALKHDLSARENQQLNQQLNELKDEITILEQKLQIIVH